MAAIERALEAELGCGEVLNLVASIRGAVTGLTAELIEDHIRDHIAGAATPREPMSIITIIRMRNITTTAVVRTITFESPTSTY